MSKLNKVLVNEKGNMGSNAAKELKEFVAGNLGAFNFETVLNDKGNLIGVQAVVEDANGKEVFVKLALTVGLTAMSTKVTEKKPKAKAEGETEAPVVLGFANDEDAEDAE